MKKHITVILTGGTMDSHFDHLSESIRVNKKSAIKNFLDSLKLHIDFTYQRACTKDSRDLNQEDREKILEIIKKSSSTDFLIIHGTYTMPATAQFLKAKIKNLKGKKVMLVGSMKPMLDFINTDAPFNLGFAISSLLNIKSGIYLAMNGNIFEPENVFKNIKKDGRYEYIKKLNKSK